MVMPIANLLVPFAREGRAKPQISPDRDGRILLLVRALACWSRRPKVLGTLGTCIGTTLSVIGSAIN